MSEEFDPKPFELTMWNDVAELEKVRLKIEALQGELALARAAVGTSMHRYGAALSISETPVSRAVIRKLYWEHRDVHAESIAKAFAIPGGAGQVHRFAGEHFFDVACPAGCGSMVRLAARTAKIRSCAECEATRQQQANEQFDASRKRAAEKLAERETWIRTQVTQGRTVEELYVELVGRWETNGPLPRLRELAAEVNGISAD